MAEGLPTGAAAPDTVPTQETRGRRQNRRNLARGTTNRENTASPETRVQAQALANADTSEVGTGLMAQIANFPIDVAAGLAHVTWKMAKGTAKFGGRAAVGGVKYPVMAGGVVALGGGAAAGGLIYAVGKGAKIALGPATHFAIHYDKKFGEGFDNAWKFTRETVMGMKSKK